MYLAKSRVLYCFIKICFVECSISVQLWTLYPMSQKSANISRSLLLIGLLQLLRTVLKSTGSLLLNSHQNIED